MRGRRMCRAFPWLFWGQQARLPRAVTSPSTLPHVCRGKGAGRDGEDALEHLVPWCFTSLSLGRLRRSRVLLPEDSDMPRDVPHCESQAGPPSAVLGAAAPGFYP